MTDNLVATKPSVTKEPTEENLIVDAPHITPQKDNFALPDDDDADQEQNKIVPKELDANKTGGFSGAKGL